VLAYRMFLPKVLFIANNSPGCSGHRNPNFTDTETCLEKSPASKNPTVNHLKAGRSANELAISLHSAETPKNHRPHAEGR